MDAPNLYEWGLGAATAIVGWMGRTIYGEQKELRQDIMDHKVYAAREYVTHDDLAEIKASLVRIEERLNK